MDAPSDSESALMNRLVELSDGNPGAATTLSTIVNERPGEALQVLETLDAMNIRGSRIWLGYKDYCGQDIDDFVDSVLAHDEEMVELINDRSFGDEPPVTADIN